MDKPKTESSVEEARVRARSHFATAKPAKPAAQVEREKQRQADTDKMLRLRALRLDKEAAEKAEQEALPKVPKRKSAPKTPAAGPEPASARSSEEEEP